MTFVSNDCMNNKREKKEYCMYIKTYGNISGIKVY